jgi:hypothetical protein
MKNIFLTFLITILLISCNNSDEEFDVTSDVYSVNKKFGEEVKSAVAYYAYSSQNLASGTVTLPENSGTIDLEYYPGAIKTLAKEPKDSDFSTETPVSGKYKFTITGSNGGKVEQTDSLAYMNLGIPEFTKLHFDGNPVSLELEWNLISDAQGYVVKMFDLERKLIFTGFTLNGNVKNYIINSSSGTGYWSGTVSTLQQYIVQINAIAYDSEATNDDYLYNVNEVSVGESQITWGVNQ